MWALMTWCTSMADPSRPRTAYDRLVMAGQAPHVLGGLPTAEERSASPIMKGKIMDRFNRSPYRPDSETWDQYVIRAGHYTVHRVCGCCESIIANGEGCDNEQCQTCGQDVGEGLFAAASRSYPGHLTLGAFTRDCTHEAERDEHCDQCESFGFMRSSCTWCGNPVHGDRVAAIFWPAQADDMVTGGVSWE